MIMSFSSKVQKKGSRNIIDGVSPCYLCSKITKDLMLGFGGGMPYVSCVKKRICKLMPVTDPENLGKGAKMVYQHNKKFHIIFILI